MRHLYAYLRLQLGNELEVEYVLDGLLGLARLVHLVVTVLRDVELTRIPEL